MRPWPDRFVSLAAKMRAGRAGRRRFGYHAAAEAVALGHGGGRAVSQAIRCIETAPAELCWELDDASGFRGDSGDTNRY